LKETLAEEVQTSMGDSVEGTPSSESTQGLSFGLEAVPPRWMSQNVFYKI